MTANRAYLDTILGLEADCPNPQRADSQKVLPQEQRIQSWRPRCELGQLALHFKDKTVARFEQGGTLSRA